MSDMLVDFRRYVVVSRPGRLEMAFPNGWGVSIIGGGLIGYGDGRTTFELGVLHDGKLHYNNPVAQGDVLGYLSIEEVREVVGQVFAFGPLLSMIEGNVNDDEERA